MAVGRRVGVGVVALAGLAGAFAAGALSGWPRAAGQPTPAVPPPDRPPPPERAAVTPVVPVPATPPAVTVLEIPLLTAAAGHLAVPVLPASGLATPVPAPLPPDPSPPSLPLIYLNSQKAVFGYDVTRKGASDVREVALWVTADDGKTWKQAATAKPSEPLQADLGKDGRYGARLVLVSGAGVSTDMPKPGDKPEMVVVVDTKPPEVMLGVKQISKANVGTVQIAACCSEENPDRGSVRPAWRDAENAAAGWHEIEIARNECVSPSWAGDSSGVTYTWDWVPAATTPVKVIVRVVVTDLTGNATAKTAGPVFTDTVNPKGRLTGVRPALGGPPAGGPPIPELPLPPAM